MDNKLFCSMCRAELNNKKILKIKLEPIHYAYNMLGKYSHLKFCTNKCRLWHIEQILSLYEEDVFIIKKYIKITKEKVNE